MARYIDPRLTVLEDNCILGEGSIVTSHTMVSDRFILRQVRVGKGATVGVGQHPHARCEDWLRGRRAAGFGAQG